MPSLRESVIQAMGYDYDYLLENKGKDVGNGVLGRQVIARAHETALALVDRLVWLLENEIHPIDGKAVPENILSDIVTAVMKLPARILKRFWITWPRAWSPISTKPLKRWSPP